MTLEELQKKWTELFVESESLADAERFEFIDGVVSDCESLEDDDEEEDEDDDSGDDDGGA